MKQIKLFIEGESITELRPSGIGHMTLELVRAMSAHPSNGKDFEIVIVVAFDKIDRIQRWNLQNVTYKTIPLPMRLLNLLWKLDWLPPMDIVLGKGVYLFPNYKNWRLARSKNLTVVCDVSYLLYPQYVQPKNQKFLAGYIRKWVARADKVVTISKSGQKEIHDHLGLDQAKTFVMPCGVDKCAFYKRSSSEIGGVVAKYGLKHSYILYVGNIEPRKNIIRLIDAYKILPELLQKKHPLALVGGGGWLNEPIMRKIAREQKNGLNIIRPNAYVPDGDMPALYSGATICILPALYEGFGLPLLEAMACGTPVIAANNSSLPEVVGDGGLLVDAENVTDISDKMNVLLGSKKLRATYAKKGLERSKKFSWDDAANIIVSEITKP